MTYGKHGKDFVAPVGRTGAHVACALAPRMVPLGVLQAELFNHFVVARTNPNPRIASGAIPIKAFQAFKITQVTRFRPWELGCPEVR